MTDPGGAGPATWHRLHPLSPIIRAGRSLVAIVVVFGGTLLPGAQGGRDSVVWHLLSAGALAALGAVSWWVTRWRIQDGVLRIETGVIRHSSMRFPLTQIQAIDTVRPALARVVGLAELRLRMGGSTGGAGRLAYLPAGQADVIRARLLALASGQAEDSPEPGEVILISVPIGRLLGSILLSWLTLLVAALLTALIVLAVLAPAAVGAVIGSSGASGIGLVTLLWHRFNGGYRLTVAEAPDGLRLRSGLLETSAETIPSGRVQAVRMVEPVLWRPLGWCRLEVDVAGHQRHHGENSPEGHRLRAVLPVGSHEEADRLLGRILTDAPNDRLPAPRRARLRNPVRYHNLAWGRTSTCAVTTTGRVARVTAWVPLTKVQSLRLVQGPFQRALRLATIHLDTAGHGVHAALRDRDAGEADRLLSELVGLCRAARRSDRPPAMAAPR
ncbi:MAG: PH domain-containing protein [Candidatus Dormibacteraceae bacterium]